METTSGKLYLKADLLYFYLPQTENYPDSPNFPNYFGVKMKRYWVYLLIGLVSFHLSCSSPSEDETLDSHHLLAWDFKQAVRFTQHQAEKEMIVVRGDYRFQPLAQSLEQHLVHVNPDTFYTKDSIHSTGNHTSLPGFFRSIGHLMNVQFICEMDPPLEKPIAYKAGLPSEMLSGKRAPYLERVLNNLTHQTGLEFTVEQRAGKVWTAKTISLIQH